VEPKQHHSGSFSLRVAQDSQTDSGRQQTESGRLRSRGMQYRRLMVLGTGGMATVHLALAIGPGGFNRLVVVKAMRDELLEIPEARAMFLDEARLCARFNHPNVVQVSEVVDSPGGVMIVMEYLDGRPLSAIYRAGGGLTLAMRLRIVCEVLAGLHYVHQLRDLDGAPLGAVHRDVSPHNVFITFDGRVKLLDFGIAKVTADSEHTKTGIVKGKLTYMPAEQLRGQPVDLRSDIYSVGCVLWEAIAGSRIWAKRPDGEIMHAVLRGEIPPLSSRVEVDPELERIVERAMALAPEDRYGSAEDMRMELEQVLLGLPPMSTRDIGELLSVSFAEARELRRQEAAQLIAALPEGDVARERIATEFQVAVTRTSALDSAQPPARRRLTRALVVAAFSIMAALAALRLWRPDTNPSPGALTGVAPASRPLVTLSVSVVPTTARVIVDDGPASLGNALLRGELGSEHSVRAEFAGYSSIERRVTLTSDTSMTIELSLQPAPTASFPVAPTEPPGKPSGKSIKTRHPFVAPPSNPEAALPVRSSNKQAACSPPYYFVSGIKTFKPECI
jgi:serine/threonine protein kinase